MNQDEVFLASEADRWFARNQAAIESEERFDWPLHLLENLSGAAALTSFLELGCSNGWRLGRLHRRFGAGRRYVGVEPGEEALARGRARHPEVEFHRGLLSEVPLSGSFDVVIVNYVFHWVDRESLAASVAEVDRLVAANGYLVIGDFLPDYPQKRSYHHLPGSGVYTFKQDYARIFLALGTWSEIARISYPHGEAQPGYAPAESGDRGVCCLLRKVGAAGYPELGS